MDTATRGSATEDPPGRVGTKRFSDLFRPFIERSPRLTEGLLYVIALGLAWNFRFVEDDAFITYRYAQNLANGKGLVFNPGERVEGYTNFLWTVIQAIPEKLGWTTPLFGEILGLVVLVATVAVALRLARAVMGDETRAVFAVLVLLANMTFIGYGTSGMEEMFQCLLVTSIGLLLLPDIDHPRLSLLARRLLSGVLAGIALLTRLDSTVLVAAWFVMSVVAEWRLAAGTADAATSGPVTEGPTPEGRVGRAVSGALAMGLPVLVLVIPWLVWKHSYYGSLLPNTFSAKTGTSKVQPFLYGIFYLVGFGFSYAAFLLIGRWRRLRRGLMALPGMRFGAVAVGLWCLYIVVVGADFMEFRFMVPILPFLAIAAAYLIDHYSDLRREIALLLVLAIFSLGHMELRSWAFPVFVFRDLSHLAGQLHGQLAPDGHDSPRAVPWWPRRVGPTAHRRRAARRHSLLLAAAGHRHAGPGRQDGGQARDHRAGVLPGSRPHGAAVVPRAPRREPDHRPAAVRAADQGPHHVPDGRARPDLSGRRPEAAAEDGKGDRDPARVRSGVADHLPHAERQGRPSRRGRALGRVSDRALVQAGRHQLRRPPGRPENLPNLTF